MSKKDRKHIFLISGQLTFRHKDSTDDTANSVIMTGIYINSDKQILMKDLGRMQQVLQLNFHNGTDGAMIEILDVQLLNVSYLAFASEEEFKAPPAGTKLVQKQTAPESFAADPAMTIEQAAAQAQQKKVEDDLSDAEAQSERA